jgi:hypothetical protein
VMPDWQRNKGRRGGKAENTIDHCCKFGQEREKTSVFILFRQPAGGVRHRSSKEPPCTILDANKSILWIDTMPVAELRSAEVSMLQMNCR